MSPRAAWQLERLGFEEVYDFVDGKLGWVRARLPLEGRGPHYFIAAEVVDPSVVTCSSEASVADALVAMEEGGEGFCVVVNEARVVLGRVRRKKIEGGSDRPVVEVMEPGPATIRPVEPLQPLVERMQKAKIGSILVTTEKGRLLGAVRRTTAEDALEGSGALRVSAS